MRFSKCSFSKSWDKSGTFFPKNTLHPIGLYTLIEGASSWRKRTLMVNSNGLSITGGFMGPATSKYPSERAAEVADPFIFKGVGAGICWDPSMGTGVVLSSNISRNSINSASS